MTTEPTPADTTSTEITAAPPPVSGASTEITAAPPASGASADSTPAPAVPENLPTAAPPVGPTLPPAWVFNADLAILGLLLILSFFLASFIAGNSDLWFNLAVGKRISQGKFEFGVDPFSWATEAHDGQPAVFWVDQSWLFSWIVYQLYNLVGGAGLVLGKAVLFTVTIGLLCRVGWNEANRWFLLICLVMAALAVSTRLLVQPITVSYLFLAITLYLLDRAHVFALTRTEGAPADSRCLWLLPPLFALWANLDSWFILGPIMLALCWAATGLARWFPNGNPVSGKTLGAVLGVGLLACLLNPYHVRVFQLPGELAYLVLAVTDPLKIPVPNELVAAGRTLKEITKAEPNAIWTTSAISSTYWQPHIGFHIAGLAFLPLLVLGLLSFTLVALVRPQPNAPTLHAGRFLLWLAFAVPALALHRMIPFFVLVAAPLTAMTLGEFLLWQQTSNAIAVDRRNRGLHMARFSSIPFLLLLIFLAWPGWLHGSYEYYSPHRVAWDLRPDPSAKQAALALQALHEKKQCGNVFTISMETANYLPWFAPDVKYYRDTRFSLYPGQTAIYHKVRLALIDPTLPADDWRPFFKERKIDQVVVVNFMTKDYQRNLLRWWLDADHWRQRYADTRVLVFSWSESGWPINSSIDDFDRLAFGRVPEDERPPSEGTPPPPSPTFWTLYLEGVAPPPVQVAECKMLQERFLLTNALINQHFRTYGMLVMTGSLTGIPAATQMHALSRIPALDYGPPALPLLMVREARKAVAENPREPDSHLILLVANEVLRSNQEDWWTNFRRATRNAHPSSLRDRLRQVELVTAAYNIVQLRPDAPEQHKRLAELYQQQNMLDLALDHWQAAEKGLEILLNTGKNAPKDPKERAALLRKFRADHIDDLEKSVRLRLAKYKDNSDARSPLKNAEFALHGSFHEVREGGMRQESRLGLAKKALELLGTIDQKSLKKDEAPLYIVMHLDLLVSIGRADAVANDLKEVRDLLPPYIHARYQLLAGAGLGDYDAMDKALVTYEAELRKQTTAKRQEIDYRQMLAAPSMILAPTRATPIALIDAVTFALPLQSSMNEAKNHLVQLNYELYNTMTLRGILALESGATKHARTLFAAVLNEAGAEHGFSDRPIARRYLELLNEQWR